MLVFKINPIAGFVANDLCLVLSGYVDGFLYSKALTGLFRNLLKKKKKKKRVESCTGITAINRLDPLTWPISNTSSDLAINPGSENFHYSSSNRTTGRISPKELNLSQLWDGFS